MICKFCGREQHDNCDGFGHLRDAMRTPCPNKLTLMIKHYLNSCNLTFEKVEEILSDQASKDMRKQCKDLNSFLILDNSEESAINTAVPILINGFPKATILRVSSVRLINMYVNSDEEFENLSLTQYFNWLIISHRYLSLLPAKTLEIMQMTIAASLDEGNKIIVLTPSQYREEVMQLCKFDKVIQSTKQTRHSNII